MSNQVFVVSLTWHCNDFKQEDAKSLFEQASKDYAKKWIFQFEKGANGSVHVQGTWDLHKKDRPKRLAQGLNDRLPGIEIRRCSNAGREALRMYCTKAETRVAGPWMDPTYQPPYSGKDLPETLWPWQQQVIDEIKTEPDDRKIVWIADPEGCIGKSKLCKWVMKYKLGYACTMMSCADTNNRIAERGSERVYMIDIPRTKSKLLDMAEVYSAIEGIKNGLISSGKYRGGDIVMDCPHVYVFSNYFPKKEAMTGDRWEIRTIDHKTKMFM